MFRLSMRSIYHIHLHQGAFPGHHHRAGESQSGDHAKASLAVIHISDLHDIYIQLGLCCSYLEVLLLTKARKLSLVTTELWIEAVFYF